MSVFDVTLTVQASAHIAAGRFVEAENALRAAIGSDSRNHEARHLLGQLACHFKNFEVAETMAAQALVLAPAVPAYHVTLGRAYRGAGRHADAAACFRRALALDSRQPDTLVLLGLSLKAQGDLAGAIAPYRQALELRPESAEAKVNLANALREQGQPAVAAALYRQAAEESPQLAEAQSGYAASLLSQGRDQEALEQYRRALALKPDLSNLQFMRGFMAHLAGSRNEAIEAYSRAVEQCPDHADAWVNLGLVLGESGRPTEALEAYRQALTIDADHVEAHINYGLGLMGFANLPQAVVVLRRAAQLRPNDPVVLNNLGAVLIHDSRVAEAEPVLRRALALQPDSIKALTNLGSTLRQPGRHAESVRLLRRAVAQEAQHLPGHDNLLLSLQYTEGVSAEEIVAAARAYGAAVAVPTGPVPATATAPGRKLRIGYVSPDFRRHSVAYFFEPVLVHHDRANFEIFCYHLLAVNDDVTQRLRGQADGWFDACGLPAAVVAERIRADGIDILVDLAGHTGHHGLGIFALQPAPVQMTWLGYPSTVGLPTIGYRITDAQVDPPGYERFNTETPLRLPHSYFCYRPGPAPEIGALPAIANGFVTFGSFNGLVKLTAATLDTWAKVLEAIPDARLLMKNAMFAEPALQATVRDAFAARCIAPERLELLGWEQQTASHLDVYNRVDIALDSFPYNGATTSCEALWMGVPVVSWCGEAHASRMGCSILAAVGLPELAAVGDEDFVRTAVALAADQSRLAALRAGLRQRLATSPLMDEAGFTVAIEGLFRQSWLERGAAAIESEPSTRPDLAGIATSEGVL